MGRKTRQGEGRGPKGGAGGDHVVDEHDPRPEEIRCGSESGGGAQRTLAAGVAGPPDAGKQQGERGEIDMTADPAGELGGGVDAVPEAASQRAGDGHEGGSVAGNEGGHGDGEGVGGGEVATVLELVDHVTGGGLVGVCGADDESPAEMPFAARASVRKRVVHRRTVPRRVDRY